MNGNAEDPVLLSFAESISEGRPVDWNQLTQSITDPEQSAIADELRMLEGFSRLNAERGLTLIFTSHDMDHAAEFADRIIAIRAGTVFFDKPAGRVTEQDFKETFHVEPR